MMRDLIFVSITKFNTIAARKRSQWHSRTIKNISFQPLNYIDIQIAYKDFSLNLNEESLLEFKSYFLLFAH